MRTRRRVLLAIGAAATVAIAAGLYWFQPWKLFVDHRVDEALPTLATGTPFAADVTATPSRRASIAPADPTPRANTVLASGRLLTHKHDTSGTVQIVRLASGKRVLTLRDLDTSDGPDVEVWLSDAPVVAGERGWYLFDDGRHTSLGDLKGNQGNQVYTIPDEVDLTRYRSVSLWCARFDVSFGAAPLARG